MNIGDRIKLKREEKNWSQDELAQRMGFKSRNAIYRYEHCDSIKLKTVNEFAKVLDCTASYLIGLDETPIVTKAEHGYYIPKSSIQEAEFDFVILSKFKQLSEKNKEEVLNYIDWLLNKQTSD